MDYLVSALLDGRRSGLSRDRAPLGDGDWFDVATGEMDVELALRWRDFHGHGYYPNQMGRALDFAEREGGTDAVLHVPAWPRRDDPPGTIY